MNPGTAVIYNHEHRGGYGYVVPYRAVVVRATAKRVTIQLERLDGQPGKILSVKPEKLRLPKDPSQ